MNEFCLMMTKLYCNTDGQIEVKGHSIAYANQALSTMPQTVLILCLGIKLKIKIVQYILQSDLFI